MGSGNSNLDIGFFHEANQLKVIIPTGKDLSANIFPIIIFSVGCLIGGPDFMDEFNNGNSLIGKVYLALFTLIWFTFGISSIYNFFWKLLGKEVIILNRNGITLQKNIVGFGRKKAYTANAIQNLRVENLKDPDGWGKNHKIFRTGMREGKLQFDYDEKTIHFGKDTNLSQAWEIWFSMKETTYLNERHFAKERPLPWNE